MGRQRIRTNQVKGVNKESLYEEIVAINEKQLTYRQPVSSPEFLPKINNNDGDIRMVLSEDCLYAWDDDTQQWYKKGDTHTERRLMKIPIPEDNAREFVTDIKVGGINNIVSLKTIDLEINGISQYNTIDFELSVESETNFLKVKWLSEDFDLEITDSMIIEYDMLFE